MADMLRKEGQYEELVKVARAVKAHLISCEHIELTLEESVIETEEKCTPSELRILFSWVQPG
jgi:hypothetical protein